MPTIRYAAPGRINLIGEHTDYNLGFTLPIALPAAITVSYTPIEGATLAVRSDREPDEVTIGLDTAPGEITGWASYVAGVVWALREAGHRVLGGSMSISSDVEMGAGLASSAALECAVLGALTVATGTTLDRIDSARLAQRAENLYVGAPTGLMDQLASLCGEPDRALLIDFRDVTVQPVPFDPDSSGMALMVINSRAPHRHADGEYAARRTSCERVATALGVSSLRDLQDRGTAVLAQISDPTDARRVRHILTENQRVLDVVAALHQDDLTAVGRLFSASHASMRDDFAITTPHIDLVADVAEQAGALGARMTGGGFGGCVIALVPAAETTAVEDAVRAAVRQAGHNEPSVFHTRAASGARRG